MDEQRKTQLVDDIRRLVRIPSRSSAQGGEEGTLQAFVAERMRGLGARVRAFEADDVPEFREHPLCHGPDRDYGGRPTVVGEIGDPEWPTLLILAHSDTVQISKPDEWTVDPFGGPASDGAIWGLGASDDKWGVAAMLAIMAELQSSSRAITKRLIFASTIDEENGVGNGTLLLALAGIKAKSALYLDGLHFSICIGCNGGSNLYLRPRDAMADDTFSRHRGALATACRECSARRAPLYDQPYFAENPMRDKSAKFAEHRDEQGRFFAVHFYNPPGEDREAFCAELQQVVSDALGDDLPQYALSYREPWFEPALIPADTPMVRCLAESIQEVRHGEPRINTVSKQDSFVLTNHARIPTVSFGVSRDEGRGAIHGPDECVSIEDAWQGCRIAYDAVCRWLWG